MFTKCRCRRFDSYKSEKSSLRADLERERLSISGNSGEDRAHIAMVPVSLLVPPNVAATIDQHISNSDPISFWRERQRDFLKVHCHAIQWFYVDFFAVVNGGEETWGRGAGQREAGLWLCRTLFLHQFRGVRASRSIDVGVSISVSYPWKVVPLGRRWALR